MLIFTSQARIEDRGSKKEALPWWIFGVGGGLLSVWLGSRFSILARSSILDPRSLAAFLPGALLGGLAGWFVIRPVNAVLGWFFRGFNHGFDRLTGGYGWTIGHALHHSPTVLLAYGVLVVLTFGIFARAPTGFIPQQDMGRFIVNVQTPDSAGLQWTRDAVARVEEIAHESPGVAHTVTVSGISFLLQASSPNFASMFVVLKPFADRRDPALSDTAIMAKLRQECRRRIPNAEVTAFPAAPLPGIGAAGGYKFMVEDRGGLGAPALQAQTDALRSACLMRFQARTGEMESDQSNL